MAIGGARGHLKVFRVSMEAVMSIRLASNSVLIKRQGFMGFKLSCSVGALAVLGVIFAGGSRSYAGVAYAHFDQVDGQKVTVVQNAPADLAKSAE